MNTIAAFARGQANQGNRIRVFDWHKAAELIRDRKPEHASAGLAGDWEWTGGTIYRGGKPVTDDYTYLASNWAIPMLDIDFEEIECWTYADESGWDSKTKWPQSAIDILAATPDPS